MNSTRFEKAEVYSFTKGDKFIDPTRQFYQALKQELTFAEIGYEGDKPNMYLHMMKSVIEQYNK